MSYYVIKGPRGQSNYLADMPEYAHPQWSSRSDARRFSDEDSAWRWMQEVQAAHPQGGYQATVVRVNTVRDWRSERAQLRNERDSWRAMSSLKDDEIRRLKAEIARMREAKER